MEEKLISVIIPVYNAAEYLPRCLDSILNNTYRNLEIICVNDGSKDSSLEVLNSYAAKDPRVKVIDQENAGVSAARNRGLDEATGEYIAFVDSDDWVHRQYFEVLLTCAVSCDAHIVTCQMPSVSSEEPMQPFIYEEKRIRKLDGSAAFSCNMSAGGHLYCSTTIGKNRFRRDIRLAEDTIFNYTVLWELGSPHAYFAEYPLYFYFKRVDSAVNSLPPRELEPLVEWYLAHLDCSADAEIRDYFLIEAMKNLLAWRYSVMFRPEHNERKRIGTLLAYCRKHLEKNHSISFRFRLVYWNMARFQVIYRLFRIINDPTMLGWEKQQRQKARETKQQ